MTIGVFDSGVGGKSVALALEQNFPQHRIHYVEDKKNIPYGKKSPEQLLSLVQPIIDIMVSDGCNLIVIACNSVTTTIIDQIRSSVSIPIIGVEPMIADASSRTKSGIIAVCATPTTLKSLRYRQLLEQYASHMVVLEPDCSEWASMIEQNQIDHAIIRNHIHDVCQQGADVIVLGCTHYHWIEDQIRSVTQNYNCQILQPEQNIINEVKLTLEQLD